MTTFMLDIWHDLREKRLWPVAIALVVATIAVPLVLFKPEAGAPQAGPPAGPATAALPAVNLDQAYTDGSMLSAFDLKDPFTSHADKGATGVPDAGGSSSAGGATSDASSGSSDDLFGGSGGSTAGGSGGSVGGSGGSTGGGKKYYTYTVDVHFGTRSKPKEYKGVKTLDLLPNDQSATLSFMGMVDGAKTAVFFIVDPSIKADGEGECNPSPEQCRFVYLGVDDDRNEETLSGAGGAVEYSLTLDKIHVKEVDAADVTGDATPDKPDSDSAQRSKRQVKNLMTLPELAVAESR